LVEFLFRFDPACIGPLSTDRSPYGVERRDAALCSFINEDEMQSIRRGYRTLPSTLFGGKNLPGETFAKCTGSIAQ
jgi:hypothetical protein